MSGLLGSLKVGTLLGGLEGRYLSLNILVDGQRALVSGFEAPEATLSKQAPVLANVLSTFRRVDETHANPRRALLEMGAPDYPTTAQLDALMKTAALYAEVGTYKWDGGALLIRLSVPPHGVAAVTLSN